MAQIGRNDPCPCGSGKKYKKCCGPKDDAGASSQTHKLNLDLTTGKVSGNLPGIIVAHPMMESEQAKRFATEKSENVETEVILKLVSPIPFVGQRFRRIRQILESARTSVARSVNTTQVAANWLIGREIVEEEQRGKRRAGYGEELLKDLSDRLTKNREKGWSVRNLEYCRNFYVEYPLLYRYSEIERTAFGI